MRLKLSRRSQTNLYSIWFHDPEPIFSGTPDFFNLIQPHDNAGLLESEDKSLKYVRATGRQKTKFGFPRIRLWANRKTGVIERIELS